MTYDVSLLIERGDPHEHLSKYKEHPQPADQPNSPCRAATKLDIKEENKQPFFTCDVNTNEQLLPYTTVLVWRNLPRPIFINNELVTRYKASKITEYLDSTTGEIIKASDLRKDPRVPIEIHFGEILLLRQALLDSMRREVKEFALFVLHFSNNRRGVTPEIDTLVDWYARLKGKRPSNVRRYVKVLEDVGFLASSSLLSPLFQRTGKRLNARDHLGEDVVARRIYFAMLLKSGRDVVSFC